MSRFNDNIILDLHSFGLSEQDNSYGSPMDMELFSKNFEYSDMGQDTLAEDDLGFTIPNELQNAAMMAATTSSRLENLQIFQETELEGMRIEEVLELEQRPLNKVEPKVESLNLVMHQEEHIVPPRAMTAEQSYQETVMSSFSSGDCCKVFTNGPEIDPHSATQHNQITDIVLSLIKSYHPEGAKYKAYPARFTKFYNEEKLHDLKKQCRKELVQAMFMRYLKHMGSPNPAKTNENIYCLHRLLSYFRFHRERINVRLSKMN